VYDRMLMEVSLSFGEWMLRTALFSLMMPRL